MAVDFVGMLPPELKSRLLNYCSPLSRHCLRQCCITYCKIIEPCIIDLTVVPEMSIDKMVTQLEGLQCIHQREPSTSSSPRTVYQSLFIQAARCGHAASMRWLLENFRKHVEFDYAVLDAVVRFGTIAHTQNVLSLDYQYWMFGRTVISSYQNTLKYHILTAIRGNHLELAEWMICNYDATITSRAVAAAIGTQNHDTVHFVEKWRKSDVNLNNNVMEAAVRTGDMFWVHWAAKRRAPTKHAIGCAALEGNGDMVKTLINHGFPMYEDTMAWACARPKNDPIVHYLFAQNCPSGYVAYESALKTGALTTLGEILYQNNCALNNGLLRDKHFMTHYGYMFKIEHHVNASTKADYEWLIDHNCPIRLDAVSFEQAVEFSNVKAMQRLCDQNCPITYQAVERAMEIGDPTVMAWLESHPRIVNMNRWSTRLRLCFHELKTDPVVISILIVLLCCGFLEICIQISGVKR